MPLIAGIMLKGIRRLRGLGPHEWRAVKREIANTVREVHRVLRREGLLIANLASVEDHRFGKGEKVEEWTFKIKEEFEEREFEGIHHFFTREEASKLLADFTNEKIETINNTTNIGK